MFARWVTEQECLAELLLYQDEEAAKAILEEIRYRVQTGTLFKKAQDMQIIKSADGEIIVYGPCSWEKVDTERDLITTKAMVRFFDKLFNKVKPEYRNIQLDHGNLKAGEPLLKAVGSDGKTYYTHVHEKGAMLVSRVRPDDGLSQTKELRENILKGIYKSYSISGRPIAEAIHKELINGVEARVIDDIDPTEVTFCKVGINDMASFDVIHKSEEKLPYQLLKDAYLGILNKMTWEECIAEASKDPDVDDPEKLCGWLRYHGPNAKSADLQKPFAGFDNWDDCMAHMTASKESGGGGYDEETARKVCGKLQSETEKGCPECKPTKEQSELAWKLATEKILDKYGFNKTVKVKS